MVALTQDEGISFDHTCDLVVKTFVILQCRPWRLGDRLRLVASRCFIFSASVAISDCRFALRCHQRLSLCTPLPSAKEMRIGYFSIFYFLFYVVWYVVSCRRRCRRICANPYEAELLGATFSAHSGYASAAVCYQVRQLQPAVFIEQLHTVTLP